MHTYMHMHIHYVQTGTHKHARTHTHMHAHTCTYTHGHTHMHTCTYTCTCIYTLYSCAHAHTRTNKNIVHKNTIAHIVYTIVHVRIIIVMSLAGNSLKIVMILNCHYCEIPSSPIARWSVYSVTRLVHSTRQCSEESTGRI